MSDDFPTTILLKIFSSPPTIFMPATRNATSINALQILLKAISDSDLKLKIADFYETAKTIFSQVSLLSCEGLSLRLEKKQIRIVVVEVCDARNGEKY